MPDFKIENRYIPGSIGRITEIHGTYYHDQWKFGLYFEAKVARELSEFLQRYDKERDGFWTFIRSGRVEGSIVIDGLHAENEGAHLRWFIVSSFLRGRGIGRELINKAIRFCWNRGYRSIYLWTFKGLYAAGHLYENAGFKLVEQKKGLQWGSEVMEQRFLLKKE